MNHTKRAAVDAFIKLKIKGNCTSSRYFLKNPNPLSLGIGIHSNSSCLNVAPPPEPESPPTTLGEALSLFDKLTKQQPLPCGVDQFNQLLESLTKMNHYPTSLDIFKQSCSLGVTFDNYTINTVINCCCQLYRTNEGFSVLGWNLKRACSSIPDVHTFSILLDGLVLEDRSLEAQAYFTKLTQQKLCEPDTLLYNKIIGGLCSFRSFPKKHDHDDGDLRLAKTMMKGAGNLFKEKVSQQGISPDVVTYSYNSLLSGLCKLHCWREASMLLKQMLDTKISPNVQTCNILVTALCNEGKIDAANLILYFMVKNDISLDIVTYNSVIEAYFLLGDITEAMTFFDMMVSSDVVPDALLIPVC